MLKEISYNDLNNHPLLLNLDRYTNRKGIKFYTQCTTIYNEGTNYGITFIALPKNNDMNNLIQIKFNFLVSLIYMSSNDVVSKNRNEFFYFYGIYEFRKFLNEIDELKNTEHTFNVTTQNYNRLEIQNDRLAKPIDYEEEERLDSIAENIILKKYYYNASKERLDDYLLKELSCVPDVNFNRTFEILKTRGFLDEKNFSLTKDGIAYFKNSDKSIININSYSKTVFVAQSFQPDIVKIYKDVFEPITKKFDLTSILISDVEMKETIDNAILDQITQSRFIICDLTYARPSVYFEAGYTTGKGIQIFYTCRGDHNSDDEKFHADINKVHFDVRNRKITWWEQDKLEEFKNELSERINIYLNSQNVN